MESSPRSRAVWRVLLVGVLTGCLGAAAFGTAHAMLIVPIWGRVGSGLPFAVAGGCTMAWAYHELLLAGRIGLGPLHGIAFGICLWAVLLAPTAFSITGRAVGFHGKIGGAEVLFEVAISAFVGAATGWLLARRWRVALAAAAAAAGVLLTQAGPVAVNMGPRAVRLFAALSLIYALGGLCLGRLFAIVERRAARTAGPT